MPNLKKISFKEMREGKIYIYKTYSEKTKLKLIRKLPTGKHSFSILESTHRPKHDALTSGDTHWWDDGFFYVDPKSLPVENEFKIKAKNGKTVTCLLTKTSK